MLIDVLLETLIDLLKIIPFLYLTFLLIELIEHKFSVKAKEFLNKSEKYGFVLGSFMGVIPNCGFSIAATNFYITRVISLGTLISIYLSTSDEMLPILISSKVDIKIILIIILLKFFVGLFSGLIIDSFFVKRGFNKKFSYDVCNDDHCDCEHSIIKSSIKHTLKTLVFICIISFIINVLFEYASDNFINKLFMKNTIFAPFLGSLIGLIPNCGASVVLTELFVNDVISFGTCISGLLTGSGVAIAVLFKLNKNFKENIAIICILYFVGVLVGILSDFFVLFI